MKRALILAFIAITFVPLLRAQQTGSVPPYADMSAARAWCDSAQLHRIEGIWEFPDDGLRVLICAAKGGEADYEMRVVGAYGTTLRAGHVVGRFMRTSHPDRFRLMMRDGRNPLAEKWTKCAASLTASDAAIDVAAPSRKFTFNPLALLPYFWRVARMRTQDPAASLPHGLVRIYPAYDGNDSSPFNPRYL